VGASLGDPPASPGTWMQPAPDSVTEIARVG
jgi:hypothetical protein